MKRTPAPRALTFLGSALLLLAIFEACSNDDGTPASPFSGPPSISITRLSFGPATVADGAPACGNPLGVVLDINNWLLKQPGLCESTPQCGQVRVTVSRSSDSTVLAKKTSVSAGVDLDLASPLAAGSYDIEAELIDDDGNVYNITDAGSSSVHESFEVSPPADCSNGAAGAAGAPSSEAGAGGFSGAPPDVGAGGTGGSAAGAGGG